MIAMQNQNVVLLVQRLLRSPLILHFQLVSQTIAGGLQEILQGRGNKDVIGSLKDIDLIRFMLAVSLLTLFVIHRFKKILSLKRCTS